MTNELVNVIPGQLITAGLFNDMIDKIKDLEGRVTALERTATGTIFGTVNENVKGVPSPIKGARVYARTDAETRTTQTDQDGKYSITNLLPGNYQVKAEAENFVTSLEVGALVASGVISTVNFVLTSSVNMVKVPDVQGRTLSEALTMIGTKLKVAPILDMESNIIDPNGPNSGSRIVINQNINEGFVPEGTPMKLFLAAAPKTTPIMPSITGLRPSPRQGQISIIAGSGFGSEKGKGKVTFSGVEVTTTETEWSDSKISVTLPENAPTGSQDVKVTNKDGIDSNPFNVNVAPF